ncbi:MAG: acetoin utilization protein AcuC [Gammaproteobacteria bacterium]|nr:acetoin utilization protein AcuC [Gammaproteobacteria bacterium]
MTTVYYGKALAAYGFGEDHPFGPDRLDAFWNAARKSGLDRKVEIASPVSASKEELEFFHTQSYIEKLIKLSATGSGTLDCGDTPAYPGIYESAAVVAGCVLDGARRIVSGDTNRVFVPIAGLHHARRDTAAGFCAVNDVGILIEALRKNHDIQRIAYVDIDAHHGDGVFYEYENDPDIYIADIHEDGNFLYPGTGSSSETGTGAAKETKLNLPLTPPHVQDADFYQAWEKIEDFLVDASPEFIILQAGADSILGDPITHMALTPAAHAHATRQLCRIADEHCQGRLLVTGGGGYNRQNIARAWTAVLEAML